MGTTPEAWVFSKAPEPLSSLPESDVDVIEFNRHGQSNHLSGLDKDIVDAVFITLPPTLAKPEDSSPVVVFLSGWCVQRRVHVTCYTLYW
jgi:hypothetical protein